MMSARSILFLGLCAGTALSARGGGGPQNVLVVVNDNSATSLDIGRFYAELRGVPDRNLLHVQCSTNYSASDVTFSNEVRQPVLDYVRTSGLSNQIDYVVFTRDMPYRVYNGSRSNGATAVMFYGFKTYSTTPSCTLPAATFSDYFESERAFRHAGAPSSNRYYLSTVLVTQFPDVLPHRLDGGAAADGTSPTGRVLLLHTADPQRNVRWAQYDNVVFNGRFIPSGQTFEDTNSESVINESNIVGYVIGRQTVDNLDKVGFVPGALADHLTSLGGHLLDPEPGTMSALNWLNWGACGSYGTVTEPCNYTNKFPQARVHNWYGRGFNLAESYWMSVQNPYMSVVVGDPLLAPYAHAPEVSVSGLSAGDTVTDAVPVTVSAVATGGAGRVSGVDLFLDGVLLAHATNETPTPGNTVTVAINGTNATPYIVLPGDTLEDVASGVAAKINLGPGLGVTARSYGDRVEVVQNTLGASGAWMTCTASSAQGVGSRLTVFPLTVFTNFLESPVSAKEGISLSGVPVAGDRVKAVIRRTDNAVFTNEVVAGAGATAALLLSNLVAAINADTNLQDSTGCYATWMAWLDLTFTSWEAWLVARTNGWLGNALFVTYSVTTQAGSTLVGPSFSDSFNDNGDVLGARATLFMTEGETNLQAGYDLAVTNLPDGPHELMAVAYEGSSVHAQGRWRVPFVVRRHELTCVITSPVPGHFELRGGSVSCDVAAVSPGTVTQVQLYVEGKIFGATSTPPYRFTVATTNLGAGSITLQALARDDGGRATLSDGVSLVVFTDNDGDGMSDQWEYHRLGSATGGLAGVDNDGDGFNNLQEYLADTDPSNVASRLSITSVSDADSPAPFGLAFGSHTTRVYSVGLQDGSLPDSPWTAATGTFTVAEGTTTWTDTPTNAPAATNFFRLYRVSAGLP